LVFGVWDPVLLWSSEFGIWSFFPFRIVTSAATALPTIEPVLPMGTGNLLDPRPANSATDHSPFLWFSVVRGQALFYLTPIRHFPQNPAQR